MIKKALEMPVLEHILVLANSLWLLRNSRFCVISPPIKVKFRHFYRVKLT